MPRAEIVITGKDLVSQTLNEIRGNLQKTATSANTLSGDMKGAMAQVASGADTAGETVRRASEKKVVAFTNARVAAQSLASEIGISLPRATTAFLAKSELVGPALSTAFSAVAVAGLVIAIGQQLIPVVKSLEEEFTGWNKTSQEAYAQFKKDNAQAVKDAEELRKKLHEISTIGLSSPAKASSDATFGQTELARKQYELSEINRRLAEAMGQEARSGGYADVNGGLLSPDQMRTGRYKGMSTSEIQETIAALRAQADTLAVDVRKLMVGVDEAVTKADFEINKDYKEWQAKEAEKASRRQDAYMRAEGLANRNAGEVVGEADKHDAALESGFKLRNSQGIEDAHSLIKLIDEIDQSDASFGRARGDFNRDTEAAQDKAEHDAVQQAEASGRVMLNTMKDNEKLWKANQQRAGEFWDFFFKGGQSMAQKFLGLLESVGRQMFVKQFAGSGGGPGGIFSLGGLIGGSGGGAGGFPGLGGSGGISSAAPGLLGGILGHAGSVTAVAPGAGGLGGTLTTSGSGLLGMGSAAVPLIGAGIAAGFILGPKLFHLFSHHTQEAKFYDDPLKNGAPVRSFAYDSVEVLREIARNTRRLGTASMKTVVTTGMAEAMRDDRARSSIADSLLGD